MSTVLRDIKLLDCTLRDGGYINDNNFGRDNTNRIIEGLEESRVDLIEYGYLEDKELIEEGRVEYKTFEDLYKVVGTKKNSILMLLGEKYNISKLPPAPSQDCALRISFHKKNAELGLNKVKKIIEKGYKVFIQPTATMSYTNDELKELLRICNRLKPVSVAIVDTFGQMSPDDVEEKVKLFDKILDDSIAISFHAHNNLQNAYANAIRFIETTDKGRKIIIDTSIYGMGRGAGNLPTELMMSYLNKNCSKKYNIDPLLTVVDDIIAKIKEKNSWGYSLPYYLSGVYGVHPSYILTFMERKTQNSDDIKQLISMVSDDKKSEFDHDYANDLYNSYNNKEINDSKSKKVLTEEINGRNILLLGPGKTLENEKVKIKKFIVNNKPYIIGVNGKYSIKTDAVFFSNKKRYEETDLRGLNDLIMLTSNIKEISKGNNMVFNYGAYLAKGCGVSDNALLMLLNILKSVGVKKVYLAGFDGYDVGNNFYKGSLELLLDKNYVNELNEVIKTNIKKLRDDMMIESITSSKNI